MTNPPNAVTSSVRAPLPLSSAGSRLEDVPPSPGQISGGDRKDEKMKLDDGDRAKICEGWKKPQQFVKGGKSI